MSKMLQSPSVILVLAAVFAATWILATTQFVAISQVSSNEVEQGHFQPSLLSAILDESKGPNVVENTRTSVPPLYKMSLSDWAMETHVPPVELGHSLVHCVGDNFLPSAWVYRSCQYRNLCWNSDGGEWALYPTTHQMDLENAWQLHVPSSSTARHSNSFHSSRLQVSPVSTTPLWMRQNSYKWAPKVIPISSTSKPHTLQKGVVGVPIIVPQRRQNPSTFDFLFDTLLPIYNLLGLFGWQDISPNQQIHVYLINSDSNSSGSEADQCGEECQQQLRQDLEYWIGFTLQVPKTTKSSTEMKMNGANPTTLSSFCLDRAAAGMGFLSASGLSKGGYETKDYSPFRIHNHGRGATLWEFRNRILQHLDQRNSLHSPVPSMATVAISNQTFREKLVDNLEASANGAIITHIDVSMRNVTTLLESALQSHVWVTRANDKDSTWPAFFMPHGSKLILLYDESIVPTMKGKAREIHPAFPNFDLWNHISHLQVHWLALQHNEADLAMLIAEIITRHTDALTQKSASPNGTATNALFNGHRLTLINEPPATSTVHCIGNNWEWDTASYQSCVVRNMCFDVASKTFQLGPTNQIGDDNVSLENRVLHPHDSIATVPHGKQVMMGQALRFGSNEPWFPNHSSSILGIGHIDKYYALPTNVVWLPYIPMVPNANNPGHLLWDYILPLFTLIELFLTPFPQDTPSSLEGTDFSHHNLLVTNLDTICTPQVDSACYNLMSKYLPLLGVDPQTFRSASQSNLTFHSVEGKFSPESNLVCTHQSAFGIGMLTDHGFKKHGQLIDDYQSAWNVGRGMAFWRFRNFMVQNMIRQKLITPKEFPESAPTLPLRITFSINSSKNPSRRRDFSKHVKLLKSQYNSSSLFQITIVELGTLSLPKQLQLIRETSIFISVGGGSASTAMFLERNACLILYYNDLDDFVKSQKKTTPKMPAMLDWDFWNHASYLRVHWLPISSMNNVTDLELFGRLIEQELFSFRFL